LFTQDGSRIVVEFVLATLSSTVLQYSTVQYHFKKHHLDYYCVQYGIFRFRLIPNTVSLTLFDIIIDTTIHETTVLCSTVLRKRENRTRTQERVGGITNNRYLRDFFFRHNRPITETFLR